MTVIVYTKADCYGCVATKKRLGQRGIPFEEIDIHEDPNTLTALAYLGFTSAPVVSVATDSGDRMWAGYSPDRIDGLVGL